MMAENKLGILLVTLALVLHRAEAVSFTTDNTEGILLIAGIGAAGLVILLIIVFCCCCRNKKATPGPAPYATSSEKNYGVASNNGHGGNFVQHRGIPPPTGHVNPNQNISSVPPAGFGNINQYNPNQSPAIARVNHVPSLMQSAPLGHVGQPYSPGLSPGAGHMSPRSPSPASFILNPPEPAQHIPGPASQPSVHPHRPQPNLVQQTSTTIQQQSSPFQRHSNRNSSNHNFEGARASARLPPHPYKNPFGFPEDDPEERLVEFKPNLPQIPHVQLTSQDYSIGEQAPVNVNYNHNERTASQPPFLPANQYTNMY